MSTGEDLYDIIVAANIELQNLLSLLLSIYAEEHALLNPPAIGKNALHTLLSTHIVPLKKTIKPYVWKKLFTSKKCDVILSLVDAKNLDSSLLFDIFLKVEDILSIDHTIWNCKHCIGACCTGCNHISPGCKNCTGNNCTPTKKRLHPCQAVHCTKILQDCKEEHKTICCASCVTCITCNKTRLENDVIAVLRNIPTCRATCPWYTFIHSLEMTKCFRNLFGHVTIEECEDFTKNGVALNEEFKICRETEEFEVYLQFLFQHIVDHAETKLQDVTTRVLQQASKERLNNTKERLNKTMDNLKCIFDESFKKYLAENCSKIKEIFMVDRFHERLEVLITRFENSFVKVFNDKQRQDERRNKVKLVRRLNKGFVLELPLAKDEEVKVEYKRDSDDDESWKEADADQKRDGGTVYFRVEGLLHAGDFKVRLTLHSEGVTKQEIPLSVKAIECEWSIADGYLTIVAPPNRSDKDIYSSCFRQEKNNCMQKTTALAIKIVNDDECNEGKQNRESDKESDDESEDETNYVSDDESTEDKEMNADEFSKKGLRYLKRNFVKFEDVVTFPPLHMITDDLTKYISAKFADLLKQESKPGLKLVLSNYDDSKFSRFIRVPEVKKLFDGAVPATNRLLLFCSRFATIVNARIVKDKASIHQELANCINDLKLFSCTFKSVINSNVIVTGLLVCPHLSRAEVEEEMEFYFNKGEQSKRLMKYFFLTKDELESKRDESDEKKSELTKWWKKVFRKRLLKIFNSKSSIDGDILSKMFKRISGQCMATIACCDVENKSMLPTISDDPQKQILTLLLNNAQLNAIYAPEQKKLVFGPFGCGKSVIAESIVRNIYDEALTQDKKCLIMYAIQDDHSLLEVKNRRFVDKLKAEMKQRDTGDNGSCSDDLVSIESGTFHSLVGQSADGSNSLLHFVKRVIDERNIFGSISFVIDEVDHTSIEREDEIEEFKKLLKLVDHFVIFPRSAYLQVQSPGKKKLQQKSNLHQLGLKPYALEVVMRNSVEIVNLAESSQKTVEKSNSILQYPSIPFPIMDVPKHLNAPDLSKTSTSYSPIGSKRRRSHEEEFTAGNLDQKDSLVHQEEMRKTMQVDNANKFNVNFLNAAKHIDKQNPSSSKTLELGSTFIRCIPGHKVMKRKPNLINLPKTFDLYSRVGAKILSIVLDKVCLTDFNPKVKHPCGRYQSAIFDSPIIICNDMKEVKITYYALTLIPRLEDCYVVYAPDLRRKYFSWKEKEPIYDAIKMRNQILIADNCSMRGMESRHIITFINPLEKFDRHVLPEVITRANVSLDIISFPVDKTAKAENKAATLEDVVNDWLGKNGKMAKSKKLVDVIDVRALLNRKNSREMCSKVKNRLIIQVRSAQFKNYGCGNPTFEQFLDQKQEELSTEELKRTDYDRTFSKHAKKLSPTEDANHSSPNVASTSTSAVQPAVAERTGDSFFDENAAHITLKELDDLLENKSTRNKFNEIIESNPSLTKLRDDDNDTLLHEAAFHGATECVEVLIKNGSDVKEDNKYGSMAIHLAAINNHTQVMKILLSHDPSLVNVEDNDDYTPLHHAACGNHREVVELLLSQPSVDVNVRDRWIGKTPDERTDDDQIKKMIRSHRNYSTS